MGTEVTEMKETFISTMCYNDEFKQYHRGGWGCGYVHIPKDHPILVQLVENEGWGNYLQPDGCPEEITFSQWDKENDEYFVIGFDTAHSYNNDSHDEQYVIDQSNAIKALVDAYTVQDAHDYAALRISDVISKFSKFLIP
jgi:hypothetical protein